MLERAIILLAFVSGASAAQAGGTTNGLAMNGLAMNGLAMNALIGNGVAATAQSGGMRATSVELPSERTHQ